MEHITYLMKPLLCGPLIQKAKNPPPPCTVHLITQCQESIMIQKDTIRIGCTSLLVQSWNGRVLFL